MSSEKIALLIGRLLERTNEGKVAWEPTIEEGIFQASFPSYSVRVWQQHDDEDDQLYPRVGLYNAEGQFMESFAAYEFKNLPSEPNMYKVMSELYDVARHAAMGVDKAVDQLLAALDDEDDDSSF